MFCSWHDAGTYDVSTKTGGPNGSIRNQEEYSHGSNNGLKKAIDFCGTLSDSFSVLFFASTTVYTESQLNKLSE